LCAALSLVALWQYASVARRRVVHYSIASVALLGAMLAKPTGVVVPLIALLIDVLVLDVPVRHSLRRLLPCFLLVIPCLLWTRAAQTTAGVPVAPIWARPLIALDSLTFYLFKVIWPTKLTVVYERTPIQVLENGWCYFTWVPPVLLAAALVLYRRREPKLLCAAGILVVGVLPVLGLVPFQFQQHSGVADHYLYLSMLGVGLFAAAVVDRYPTRAMTCASVLILILIAVLSFRQCDTWRNERQLWEQNLAVNPNSITAHRKLALMCANTGRYDEAIYYLERVLWLTDQMSPARRPPLATSHYLLGQIYKSRGSNLLAIEQFRAALREDPQLESARQALVATENQLRREPTTR
jgi:hypothetical protein